jgi:hypothetical protein
VWVTEIWRTRVQTSLGKHFIRPHFIMVVWACYPSCGRKYKIWRPQSSQASANIKTLSQN